MSLQETLLNYVKQAVKSDFSVDLETVEFQATRKEFAGDITVVVFPMLRVIKGNPVQIGETIGNYLVEHVEDVKAFNVVKGFLNIEVSDRFYIQFFNAIKDNETYGFIPVNAEEKAVMVEYSSPNTNKPLHLGHVRLVEAQEMLQKWEAGDKDVVALWEKMNGWVYDGFAETYKNLGVDFDTLYYESNTYLLGKEFVAEGLKSGVFQKEEDGSVWCDLTEDGFDKKIVQRADGTSVYMTQDIGTAIQRIKDFPDVGGMVYTVGNEQEYHFQILFLILQKLGFDWAKNLYHLSYGMVDLPSGKMKSREGTVVDADDLMDDMVLMQHLNFMKKKNHF